MLASSQALARVNKQTVRAMFDSGANISSISLKLSRSMIRQVLKWSGGDCINNVGSTHQPLYVMKNNEIEFNGTVVKMNLAVVENLSPHVILGIDFIFLADVLIFGP